ncbi:ester cyclase [Mameliella alba]|nr:ester cyclase [Antarctobacter heliothermus]MBY6142576.1 ester cyclase [Mameliella alba]MCA0953699.1 ester cyclase [Mameliella alba]
MTNPDNTLRNKALVETFVDTIWNRKAFDRLAEFVDEGYQQHNPNLPDGRSALEGFLRGFYAETMPDGQFTIARIVAEGDMVVTHCLFKVSAEDNGTAVVDIYRIADGKLAEHWDVREAVPAATASGRPVV